MNWDVQNNQNWRNGASPDVFFLNDNVTFNDSNNSHYAVTKAALNHLTRLLAGAFGPEVRVNAVAPGLIETPWTQGEGWERVRAAVESRAPLGRVGTPEDVAEVVYSLTQSEYVTGQVVVVDGGLSLR